MKPRLAYAILIFILLIGFTFGVIALNKKSCNEAYRHDAQVNAQGTKINVQLASTEAAREKGLGGKKCLQDNQGMLFKLDKPGYYPYWMKDMNFPIDIIWIGADHRITDISSDTKPNSYPKTFINSQPAKAVLELAAGESAKLGLKSGSTISY